MFWLNIDIGFGIISPLYSNFNNII